MFGFIRPVKPELRVREVERFQCVYCGLCHAIRQEYGRLHTMFLSYDMTFLALVLTSLEETAPEIVRRRCDASPVRPKAVCTAGAGILRAADLSVLLTYHKVCDTLLDERGIKRFGARILRTLLRRGYEKAQRRLPEEDAAMESCLAELHALESARFRHLTNRQIRLRGCSLQWCRRMQTAIPRGFCGRCFIIQGVGCI